MAGFRSTSSPPDVRLLKPSERLLVDKTTGAPIGIENPNAGGRDGQFYPVPLTAAQIAAPTDEMLADTNVTYALNVAPYTRYMSNGSELVGLEAGEGVDTHPVGIFANLVTVPSGTPALTIDENSQAVIYGTWTIQSTGGVTVEGEIRVRDWPA
ncbi:MAG: hypothetical protein Q8Q14_00705 [Gemmatimonadales bacterium]|nr:hypothetical protein [Gemmatimonadales bacterium]